jgi:hypothetical protein
MFNPSIPTSISEPTRPGYRLLVALLGATAVAAVTFCGISFFATRDLSQMATSPGGELEWLRREFHLSDAQFQKIEALQSAYAPVCNQMCEKIMSANANLDRLLSEHQEMTPEVEAAVRQAGSVQYDCRVQMLAHIYKVAAQMNPDDGQRYLRLMKARVIQQALSSDTAVRAATE